MVSNLNDDHNDNVDAARGGFGGFYCTIHKCLKISEQLLARLLVAVDKVAELGGIGRALTVQVGHRPQPGGGKVAEALQAAGSRRMLAVLAAGRRRRLRGMRRVRMLLLLLGTRETQMGVCGLSAILSREVPVAALAPLVKLIAHKAPGGQEELHLTGIPSGLRLATYQG